MSNEPLHHPTPPELQQFALGRSEICRAETIASHLETCVDCRRILAQTLPDTFGEDNCAGAIAGGTDEQTIRVVDSTSQSGIDTAAQPCGAFENIPQALRDCAEYEVIREINRGGMGVVYLVRNRRLDRLEGLKVVRESLLREPGAQERFEREMQSAARLSHPNIVAAYHSPTLKGLLAFAMEFVEGIDLDRLVRERGPLPIANACSYIFQVACGLQHACEKQMVHRDIKPGNLMLRHDAKTQVVKILDFGLSKATSERHGEQALTGAGQLLGTPHYMAPEQIQNAAEADIRADLYSLGCTLYYLLTGQPPFDRHRTLYSILTAHGAETPPPVTALRPDVPTSLSAIVERLMAKDPALRFQQPQELARALAPFFADGLQPVPEGAERFCTPLSIDSVQTRRKLAAVQQPAAAHMSSSEQRDSQEPALAADFPQRRSAPRPAAHGRWRAVPLWAGLAVSLLALGGLALMAGGVFRVRTSEGILVIETNVADPEVFVDGERVLVTWGPDGREAEVRVRPGERRIEIRKAGYEVAARSLAVVENKQRIFEARLEPLASEPERRAAPSRVTPARIETSPSAPGEGRQAGDRLVFAINDAEFAFRWCPAGRFTMGSPDSEEGRDQIDEDQVEVILTQGFWMLETEVTQKMWVAVIGSEKAALWREQSASGDACPASCVDWNEAKTFCATLTEMLRKGGQISGAWQLDLPSEAQWEYACRAGDRGKGRYCLGDDESVLEQSAWYVKNSGGPNHAVGTRKPNDWGLCDMHGSVWEWTDSWYRQKLAGGADPRGPQHGPGRVRRGGGCWADASRCRSANRGRDEPSASRIGLGFRPLVALAR